MDSPRFDASLTASRGNATSISFRQALLDHPASGTTEELRIGRSRVTSGIPCNEAGGRDEHVGGIATEVRVDRSTGHCQIQGCGVPDPWGAGGDGRGVHADPHRESPLPVSTGLHPGPRRMPGRPERRGSEYTHRREPAMPFSGAPPVEQCAGHPKRRRFRATHPYTLPARRRAPGSEKRRLGMRPAGSNRRTSSTARAPSYRTPPGRRSCSAPSKASSGTPRKRALAAGFW